VMRQGSNLRLMAMGVCGVAFVTAVSCAFAAGNDAGRCYNCFPKMTEEDWLPEEVSVLQTHRLCSVCVRARACVCASPREASV